MKWFTQGNIASQYIVEQDYSVRLYIIKDTKGNFHGGLGVKTWPSNAGGMGSIPGLGAKMSHASQPKYQNIKHKQYCNKFNKDFKNSPY